MSKPSYQATHDHWVKASAWLKGILWPLLMLLTLWMLFSSSKLYGAGMHLDLRYQSKPVVLHAGQIQTLYIRQPFAEIVVGDSRVAEVFPLTSSSIYVQPLKGGISSVSFYTPDKALLGSLTIEVQADLSDLQATIRQALPDTRVAVSQMPGRVKLTGVLTNQADMDRVLALTQQYTTLTVINAMRLESAPQVELDVRILELERQAGMNLGVNLNHTSVVSNISPLNLSTGTPFGLLVSNILELSGSHLDMVIRALEIRGLAKRLANPKLVTTSGSSASFVAGGEVPISQSTTSNGVTSAGTSYREYGVRLAFAPQVLADGSMQIQVQPEVSDIDWVNGVNGQPAFITRKAQSTVIMRNGQSFAIAGLLKTSQERHLNQVPGLASVPILGALFRSSRYQANETDLVILVTPRLVQPGAAGDRLVSPLQTSRLAEPVEQFLLGILESNQSMQQNFRQGIGSRGDHYGHMIDFPATIPAYQTGPDNTGQ